MNSQTQKLMKEYEIDEATAKTALKLIESGMDPEQAVGRATFM